MQFKFSEEWDDLQHEVNAVPTDDHALFLTAVIAKALISIARSQEILTQSYLVVNTEPASEDEEDEQGG